LKFHLVVAIFPNLVANDYKLHVVVNGLVTFWLISTNGHALLKVEQYAIDDVKVCFNFIEGNLKGAQTSL
jgi:hypothetical protein